MEAGGVCPTLNAMDNGSESRATVLTVMGDVTHALTHEGHDASEDGTGRGTPVIAFGHTQDLDPQTSESVAHGAPMQVRRLTPRECERLQGFPDDWTAGQADTHRYRQMGNAVTVNVAAYLGEVIMQHAAGNKDAT